ncbi:MAG: outer membrane protein assembly factor BamE [Holosporales bacterium]|jgi:outer membrane protein assembly factor BamE (lipoprotein component of BamABCDE complex)|nr:outer membrane protein assembly factor BamE [Holosporales bacterium]
MRFLDLLLIVVICGTTACDKTMINRGYVLESVDFKGIVIGKDSAQAIFEKFGSPTVRSSIEMADGGYTWYYVSKRLEKNGFLEPKVIDQRTVAISFNAHGIVKSVTENKHEEEVEMITKKTKTEGRNSGIIGETFGGLGKYRKTNNKG